jgi:alpha-glucoside transport system permease protein
MSAKRMKDGRYRSPFSMVVMFVLAVLWFMPTLGLLITSLQTRDSALRGGWWEAIYKPFERSWTFQNYVRVFEMQDMGNAFLNGIAVAVPATIIPIMFAAFAAYAFTFMKFPFKDVLFIIIVAVMVVPIQVAFQPLLNLMGPNGLGISGQYLAVWILHTGFGMPLCIYTLRNYMSSLPYSVVESARIDGCSNFQIFWKLIAPMSTPAIAAFATLQFLWVWNDLLVGLTFAGPQYRPITVMIAEMVGSRGQAWHVLSAGAFVAMIVPLIVFLSLQRYFVRGMLAGGVKG